ncbi:ribosome small subunit-dependent GTPase A [uncultured Thermanaerothrix sp.]|uniref:ribosome small subunit-dependent GTPase A n=1 Tax=uncultured Thermanaerothrix sp. TaxID=1195149 RepID=UPI00260AAC0E|nr:ribosome small subunit-dependent GTPase A [uncultured Thermanaerothrix sp.]
MSTSSASVTADPTWGQVVRAQSGFYTVRMRGGQSVVCRLRGRLKKMHRQGDVVAVGDWVRVTLLSDGSGVIEAVAPRQRALERRAPTARGTYQQVLLANPDQLVLVFACAQPEPRLRMLDRFLVIAEKQQIPVLIVANKVDLVGLERAQEIFSIYPPLGYPVLYTSAKVGYGVAELKAHLIGKLSALAGPSGVGKSSLLNAIQPDLGLAVGSVREKGGKGRHTTVVRQLFPLEGGGYVADMPGLRTLALWDTQPEELDGYFPEIRDLVSQCQFNDCTHTTEPGCAVREAVAQGKIHPHRYESYLRLRQGEEEDE